LVANGRVANGSLNLLGAKFQWPFLMQGCGSGGDFKIGQSSCHEFLAQSSCEFLAVGCMVANGRVANGSLDLLGAKFQCPPATEFLA
jgi:hypothetical protein